MFSTPAIRPFLLLAALLLASTQAPAEVRIYGRAHYSLDWLDNGAEADFKLSSNSSRLGFDAAHTFERGLTARVRIEQDVRFDQAGSTFGARDNYFALQGGFGLLRLGYMDTPLKNLRDATDLFGDRIGDARNLVRLQELGADFDVRFRNGIHYRTPVLGTLSFDLHHSVDNRPGGDAGHGGASATSAALIHRASASYAALAWEEHRLSGDRALRVAGWRQFGAWRLTGLAQRAEIGHRVDSAGLGLQWSRDRLRYKAQAYLLRSALADGNAHMLALGVDYQWDPALTFYAAAAATFNQDAAAYRMSRGGRGIVWPTLVGETAAGLSVGAVYNF
jgi:predicted porin